MKIEPRPRLTVREAEDLLQAYNKRRPKVDLQKKSEDLLDFYKSIGLKRTYALEQTEKDRPQLHYEWTRPRPKRRLRRDWRNKRVGTSLPRTKVEEYLDLEPELALSRREWRNKWADTSLPRTEVEEYLYQEPKPNLASPHEWWRGSSKDRKHNGLFSIRDSTSPFKHPAPPIECTIFSRRTNGPSWRDDEPPADAGSQWQTLARPESSVPSSSDDDDDVGERYVGLAHYYQGAGRQPATYRPKPFRFESPPPKRAAVSPLHRRRRWVGGSGDELTRGPSPSSQDYYYELPCCGRGRM